MSGVLCSLVGGSFGIAVAPETTYATGWYSYTTDSGENNTSYVSNHQIAIMGYNSDYSIRGVAAIQPQTDTNNYLLPFKWNYSDNTWTIGTKVVTQAAPTDYRGFTGRKAVSELYPTNAGTVDATTYGATYIPGNIADQRLWIPFSVDAAGAITTYTGLATGSPSIGTSQDSGDLVYVSNASGNPLYAFFTREDAGNNTISTFTRSGNVFTKIPGINSFGTGNRATVESVVVDGGGAKACFVVFSQSGTMAAVRVAADNSYGISTSTAIGIGGKVTAVHLSNSSTTVSKVAIFGGSSDATLVITQVLTITWGATPTISVGTVIPINTAANIPDLGYYQNLRMVKGWNSDEAMLFYIKSGVVYGRYGKLNSLNRMIFDAEQTFISMASARSFDVAPIYIDSTHRYFIGMVNNSPGENQDGDMNLFAVRAQEITTPAQMYQVRTAAASVDEGNALTLTVDTLGVADGTTLYWTVQTNAGDFATSSGSFVVSGSVGTFSVTPTADGTLEGAETFTVAVRTGSTSGTVVATSVPITINDTSTSFGPTSISLAASNSSLSSSITIPSGIVTGDVAVLWDVSTTNSGVVPSGWNNIMSTGVSGIRLTISWKQLSSGESGTTVNGQSGTARKVMLVFRGNVPPTVITPTLYGQQATSATPSAQTIIAPAGSLPYIFCSGHGASTTGGSRTWNTGAPTEYQSRSTTSVYARYEIFNSSGATNTTVSMTDAGINAMASFRILFS